MNTAKTNDEKTDERWLAKMRLAANVLLSDPEEIGDGLESELYAFRDRLDVLELTARS